MTQRIFNGPASIENIKVPWEDSVRQDFHVAVYDDNGDIIYAPKFNTVSVLSDAFADAMRDSIANVESGAWARFTVKYEHNNSWPHVRVSPVVQPKSMNSTNFQGDCV